MSASNDILNSILAAVSNSLDTLFPAFPVYSEEVPENLPTRTFLIGFAGEVETKLDFSGRYKVSGKLDIAYYTPKHTKKLYRELNSIFNKLSLKLQYIQFEDVKIRLPEHKKKVVDSVLHDICSFSTFLYVVDKTPLIMTIDIDKEVVQ